MKLCGYIYHQGTYTPLLGASLIERKRQCLARICGKVIDNLVCSLLLNVNMLKSIN